MPADVSKEIARHGLLRAAINLGNPLLVSGSTRCGEPVGVAPDVARAIAERLGVSVSYVTFESPGAIADAAQHDTWDICLVAVEPKRAETMAFAAAYVEIEATYLVPEGSFIQSVEDVDQAGVRIAVADRSAYDLYLSRTLKHGQLCRAEGLSGAFEFFVSEKLDALAGLRPALDENAATLVGARVLEGRFNTVRQAIGTKLANTATVPFLSEFVREAKADGLIARLIGKHGVTGRLKVASDD